jgi:hypothetical protein
MEKNGGSKKIIDEYRSLPLASMGFVKEWEKSEVWR